MNMNQFILISIESDAEGNVVVYRTYAGEVRNNKWVRVVPKDSELSESLWDSAPSLADFYGEGCIPYQYGAKASALGIPANWYYYN